MGKITRTLIVLIAAVLMAVESQPVYAYDWLPAQRFAADVGGFGATDITGIWYANDGGSKYFRMDVGGEITFGDHANVYGIYIGNYDSLASFPDIQGESSVGTLYIEWNDQLFASGYGIKPGGSSFSGMGYGSWYDSGANTTSLEWEVPSGELPDAFFFLGATQMFPLPENIIMDQTDISAVPIPSAAWLLGSGLLGLVGLKRRRARKA